MMSAILRSSAKWQCALLACLGMKRVYPFLYIMDVNVLLPHGPTRPAYLYKLARARPHVLPFIDFKFWLYEVCRPQPILHP